MENIKSSNHASKFSDKPIEFTDEHYDRYVKNAALYNFELKAVIHDIKQCMNSLDDLNNLNERGRILMINIRDLQEKIEVHVKKTGDQKFIIQQESQQYIQSSLIKEFKEACINKILDIERSQREALLKFTEEERSLVRLRKPKAEQDGILKASTGVTDQLLSISRQLAATTQRSQDTLDNLVSSSATVSGTRSELENTNSTIKKSGKLLKKYGRREFTDKVIMFFAFLFFLAVCMYIVQKRLF